MPWRARLNAGCPRTYFLRIILWRFPTRGGHLVGNRLAESREATRTTGHRLANERQNPTQPPKPRNWPSLRQRAQGRSAFGQDAVAHAYRSDEQQDNRTTQPAPRRAALRRDNRSRA